MGSIITKFILVAMVLLSALTARAYNAEIDGIFYNFSGSRAIVTYKAVNNGSYSGDIVIPSTVTYNDMEYIVQEIGPRAFVNCSDLTSVDIPNTVTVIGEYAFKGCSGLTYFYFPENLQALDRWSLADCTGLESIVIPDGITEIGEAVFKGCTSLADIIVPSGVRKIGAIAFEDTPWFESMPNGLVYIGDVAYKYKGTIPSNTEIVLKEGTVSISGECFWEWQCTGLTSITIPNTVTSIGFGAFYNCGRLTSITIPNSVIELENIAFYGCHGLTSVVIPSSVKSYGQRVFDQCDNLESIVVESGNTVYDSRENCNAVIRTSDGVLIEGCKNTTFPEGIKVIASQALCNTYLATANLPSTLQSISNYAFQFCNRLTSIEIPDSVTYIGSFAFRGCTGLTTLSIRSGDIFIEDEAFCSNTSLTDVYCYSTEPPGAYSTVFNYSNVNENTTLHVPHQALDAYRSTLPWSEFKEIVPLSMGKCEAPTITLLPSGKLKVESSTEGSTCITNITATNAEPLTATEISLTEALVVYTVTAYATADYYEDSDVTTYTFTLQRTDHDVDGDGQLDVTDISRLINIVLGRE